MKNIFVCTSVFAIVFWLGSFIGSVGIDTALASDKLQYKVVDGYADQEELEGILNDMAADGWTYHSFDLDYGGLIFYK